MAAGLKRDFGLDGTAEGVGRLGAGPAGRRRLVVIPFGEWLPDLPAFGGNGAKCACRGCTTVKRASTRNLAK